MNSEYNQSSQSFGPNNSARKNDFDELRYSRQIFTMGRDATSRIRESHVVVVGASGLGAEISKNLVLAGVRKLTIVDTAVVTPLDFGANCLLTEADLSSFRADVCAQRLAALNPDVHVIAISDDKGKTVTGGISDDVLQGATVLCATQVVPMDELALLNTRCRAQSLPFVLADTRGVCSRVFCDLGATFQVREGPGGELPTTLLVESITQDCPATITLAEDHRHGLEEGDSVRFSGVQGMTELNDGVQRLVNPTGLSSFTIPDDTRKYALYQSGGYVQRVPRPMTLTFKPLEEAVLNPTFAGNDPESATRVQQLHAAFRAVDEQPLQSQEEVAEAVRSTLSPDAAHSRNGGGGEEDVQLAGAVLRGNGVEIMPVVALTAGVAAHEVLKACSRTATPLRQWWYFEDLDCLGGHSGGRGDKEGGRYGAQTTLFGEEMQQKLRASKWLVVGAGGIGCEVMKNLGLMGVGSIHVADPDTVHRSNLGTQMLYRAGEVGGKKAVCVGPKLRLLNPTMEVHALPVRVGSTSEASLGAQLFEEVSGVLTATDDATSRLYCDARCVFYRKPMIDGGRHGTKGSTQVFLPYESEMYASSQDPPERTGAPICTLRNFPYSPLHTLRWAEEAFSSLFTQRAADVNAYLGNKEFVEKNKTNPPTAQLPVLEMLRNALLTHRPFSFHSCVEWARLQFEDLFANNIKQLVHNFPPHMKTTAGAPFWSGTKRAPNPLTFDPSSPLHFDFIVSAANLQAAVYGLKGCQDRSALTQVLANLHVPPFSPKSGVKIAVTDSEVQRGGGGEEGATIEDCERLLEELPTPSSLAGYRLSPLSFQVEEEQSLGAEFVYAAANLRALNYGIPPTERLEARLVGGEVIPGTVTIAAVVGALMCVEVYKAVARKPLTALRHSFCNLATPLLLHAQPRPAVKTTVATRTGTPLVWTLWDRFEVDGREGMTLQGLLHTFKEQQGLEISMVSHGKSLLYAEFLGKKKVQDRLAMRLLKLVTVVGKTVVPASEVTLTFSVTCSDVNDDDVEVPDVTVRIR